MASAAKVSSQEIHRRGPRLQADARRLGQGGGPVRDHRLVGQAAKGLKAERVDLAAAQAEGRGDMLGEQGRNYYAAPRRLIFFP